MRRPLLVFPALCLLAVGGVLGGTPPFPFAPPSLESFPALYFGANASGPESLAWLAFVRRHALAGYGWQHNQQATNTSHIEGFSAARLLFETK
jgi:hypothetical protein